MDIKDKTVKVLLVLAIVQQCWQINCSRSRAAWDVFNYLYLYVCIYGFICVCIDLCVYYVYNHRFMLLSQMYLCKMQS